MDKISGHANGAPVVRPLRQAALSAPIPCGRHAQHGIPSIGRIASHVARQQFVARAVVNLDGASGSTATVAAAAVGHDDDFTRRDLHRLAVGQSAHSIPEATSDERLLASRSAENDIEDEHLDMVFDRLHMRRLRMGAQVKLHDA